MRPVAGLTASLLLLAACRAHEAAPAPIARDPAEGVAVSAPAPVLATSDAGSPLDRPLDPEEAPAPPASVERVSVEKDLPASVVRSPDGSAPRMVFLPGVCSNAYAYLLSFPEAARAHGGIVAVDGDQPCGAAGSGFRSFSWDPAKQDARLRAAMAATGVTEMPDGLTLVGYSAGASIGELMAQRWPRRYARVVLIGAPSDPSPARLSGAQGVVTMSCSRDVPGRMRDAARSIARGGVPAIYIEMPGCTHGNIADGERVFGTAFDWLSDNAKG